jgi:hypothetical protein
MTRVNLGDGMEMCVRCWWICELDGPGGAREGFLELMVVDEARSHVQSVAFICDRIAA